MSHAATKWAFDQPELFPDMSPAEFVVLIFLADIHNNLHGCYPSQQYISSRSNLSESTVRRHLNHLRNRGLINWQVTRFDGHRGFNRYYLGFEVGFTPADDAGGGGDEGGDIGDEDSAGEPPEGAGELPVNLTGSPTGQTERELPVKSDESYRSLVTDKPGRVEPGRINQQEREGAREDSLGEQLAREAAERDRLAREEGERKAIFDKLRTVWPEFALENQQLATDALNGLSLAEAKEGLERVPVFIAFHREKRGKRPLPYLAVYLREKRWADLPRGWRPAGAPAAGEAPKKFVGAFDRAWFWLLLEAVQKFGDKLKDRESGESHFVRTRINLARSNGIGWPVAAARLAEVEEGARTYVQVAVDGDDFAGWQSWFFQRGVTPAPRPDSAPFVWLPSKRPPDDRDPREAEAEARDEARERDDRGDDDDHERDDGGR
jgi:hypothetical protein